MSKIKIDTLGCCVLRDIFRICEHQEEQIELVRNIGFISPMSMFSKPIVNTPGGVESLSERITNKLDKHKITNFVKRNVFLDLNKTIFEYLQTDENTFLFMDISDLRMRVMEKDDFNVTIRGDSQDEVKIIKPLLEKEGFAVKTLCDYSEKEVFHVLDQLVEKILKMYSREKIFFLYTTPTFVYIDKYGKYIDDNVAMYKKYQECWPDELMKYNNYFIARCRCNVIEFPWKEGLVATANHTWGLFPLHYIDDVYRYYYWELVKKIEKKESKLNLQNPYFNKIKVYIESLRGEVMKNFQTETNFSKYIYEITKEDYLIVIAIRDTIGKIKADGCDNLKKLGLKLIGCKEDERYDYWKGYVAIVNKKVLQYENLEDRDMTVEYTTTVDGIDLEICSSPYRSGDRASIVVNGEEYSVNKRGFNIVVIDTLDGSVLDSVAFDTWEDNKPCFRNEDRRKIFFSPSPRDERYLLQVNEVRERLKLSNIIENFNHYRKIKIRIFQWAGSQLWSAMESVAMQFAQDDKYDLMVVVDRPGEDGEKLIKVIMSHGIKAIRKSEYSVKQDSPDIAIFNHHEVFKLADCESIKLRYVVPMALINGAFFDVDIAIVETINSQKYKIDRIFVDKNVFDKLKQDKMVGAITELSGSPKFDLIYKKAKNNKELPNEWKKLISKKVFLWAFDHNWKLKSSTADLYFKELIRKALLDEEIGLIIRPHIDFYYEMLGYGIWTKEDVDALKYFCKVSPNIIWDDSPDYGCAYSVADAIMTDVNCGIIISALPLNKPVAVLQRFDGNRCNAHYSDIIAGHYNINSLNELYSFFEMVKRGEDPKRDQRNEICNEYIAHFDGENGRRIKESIERDISELGLRG